MSNLSFKVDTSNTCRFTNNQIGKVNQAIEILQKVWDSSEFKKAISNHSWTAENGATFNRFHLSNGMSNDQVWACLSNACAVPNSNSTGKTVISVVPCATWADYNACVNSGTPCVAVNVNYVNCDWYSPVHVASAIMFDFCVNCCGFNVNTIANFSQCWNNTVPTACSTIVKDCALSVCSDVTSKFTNVVNTPLWNCFPCATTWTINTVGNSVVNPTVKVNEAICAMQFEIECLNNISKKSADEMNRYTMLINAVETMNAICNNMCTTTLDGCESVWMPVTTVQNVLTR